MNRQILVTGATGNVGREVVRLLYEGYHIKAAVRNLKNIAANWRYRLITSCLMG